MSYLFKTNNIYILAVLVLFAYFLRGWALIGIPTEMPAYTTLLSKNLALAIYKLHPLASGFLAITLLLLQAIWFNFILKKYEIIYKHTWLPAFCYILCCSLLPSHFYLSLPLIVNFIVIWLLQLLFSIYKTDYSTVEIFNAAIVLGLGFLFQAEFVLLLLLFLIAVSILKVIHFTDFMVSLIGFLIPFYIYFGISFLYDDHVSILNELLKNFDKNMAFSSIFKNPSNYLSFGVAFFIFLLGCLKLSRNYMKNMLKIRKFQALIIILLPVSLLMACLGYNSFDNNLLFCACPLTVFIAYYTMGNEWGWWKELLLDIVIGFVVYNQWQTHLN